MSVLNEKCGSCPKPAVWVYCDDDMSLFLCHRCLEKFDIFRFHREYLGLKELANV